MRRLLLCCFVLVSLFLVAFICFSSVLLCEFHPYIGCCQRTTARKTPAISTRKCWCQKLANPCPTLGQLLASRISFCTRKAVRNRPSKILYTELLKSWSTLGQLLANSPPHGKLQGSSLQLSSGNARLQKRRVIEKFLKHCPKNSQKKSLKRVFRGLPAQGMEKSETSQITNYNNR